MTNNIWTPDNDFLGSSLDYEKMGPGFAGMTKTPRQAWGLNDEDALRQKFFIDSSTTLGMTNNIWTPDNDFLGSSLRFEKSGPQRALGSSLRYEKMGPGFANPK